MNLQAQDPAGRQPSHLAAGNDEEVMASLSLQQIEAAFRDSTLPYRTAEALIDEMGPQPAIVTGKAFRLGADIRLVLRAPVIEAGVEQEEGLVLVGKKDDFVFRATGTNDINVIPNEQFGEQFDLALNETMIEAYRAGRRFPAPVSGYTP